MLKLSLLSLLIVVLVFTSAVFCDDDDGDVTSVTCGSAIKLKHAHSDFRLHSHKVSYGSGSGQQSVTGIDSLDDPNSLWIVKGPHGTHCPRGKVVKHGDLIRLQHASTRRNLHSHLHKSPFTKQNEVSCYLEGDEGDTGDVWKVEMKQGNGDWVRSEVVLFQHVDTGAYLHANPGSKYQHPIPGQIEITGFGSKHKDNEWTTAEGVYFPESSDKDL